MPTFGAMPLGIAAEWRPDHEPPSPSACRDTGTTAVPRDTARVRKPGVRTRTPTSAYDASRPPGPLNPFSTRRFSLETLDSLFGPDAGRHLDSPRPLAHLRTQQRLPAASRLPLPTARALPLRPHAAAAAETDPGPAGPIACAVPRSDARAYRDHAAMRAIRQRQWRSLPLMCQRPMP